MKTIRDTLFFGNTPCVQEEARTKTNISLDISKYVNRYSCMEYHFSNRTPFLSRIKFYVQHRNMHYLTYFVFIFVWISLILNIFLFLILLTLFAALLSYHLTSMYQWDKKHPHNILPIHEGLDFSGKGGVGFEGVEVSFLQPPKLDFDLQEQIDI